MDKNQDFTQGKILGKMVRFMVPILGALILQAMYSAVDLLIVGKFGTTAGISGVSTGSSIMGMVTFTMCALTTGVTVQIGRYLGEKREDRMGKLIGSAVWFFSILGLVQSFLIRLPMSYVMSIAPDASLTGIGLAAPTATVFGIILCAIYYWVMNKKQSRFVK